MRIACVNRKTAETDISLTLNLDCADIGDEIDTGCGFLDHMLTLFAKHSGFGLKVVCHGDINVDYHHTTEDIAITLGTAFREALGDKRGINRYSDKILPMDEALILVACDISGRGGIYFDADCPTEKVGDFDTELLREFWTAFALNSGITLHIKKLSGINSHHIMEGCFKGTARSLAEAVAINPSKATEIPSTKGVL